MELDKLFCYTSVGLKPWVKIGPIRAELEFAATFFLQPRVVNKMKNVYGQYNSEEAYKTKVFYNVALGNEIGLRLAYTLRSVGRNNKITPN